MLQRRKIIGVMGSGTEEYRERVIPLARWLAEHGYDLLTGAGQGVMRAAAEAFIAVPGRRGLSVGIVPGEVEDGAYRPKAGYPSEFIELPVFTHLPLSGERGKDSMSRNHINVLTAQALVFLPGQAGSVAEAELALRYRKPALLFGQGREFHRFPERLERTDSLEHVCEWLLSTVR
ncbi:molybdenum cofactor carrier protein [Hyalangium rubrum]|uniref:Molybdenum cofactor carrier protein n=1 Tax=Hyalangium rubrum TaxID=3103134 RepID=A0ABU5H8K5_9BACT|nr:molybdenum cofactor carrier protein [Hyalangium sp. s54d21]MDY7229631.1 molybdenum cofactor carrier protein [Hyalangium sp. s54d21]